MARTFADVQINYDWTILGESVINGDYTIQTKNNTFSAVKYVEGKRVGTLCTYSGFRHWDHGDKPNLPVVRGRWAMPVDPYRGKHIAIVLLSKGQSLGIDPEMVEAALDEFNDRCFSIDGPDMEPEKCRILQKLGIDPWEMIPNPRPNDRDEHPTVPAHQAYKICYIIK